LTARSAGLPRAAAALMAAFNVLLALAIPFVPLMCPSSG
jgi:hypothetical protein